MKTKFLRLTIIVLILFGIIGGAISQTPIKINTNAYSNKHVIHSELHSIAYEEINCYLKISDAFQAIVNEWRITNQLLKERNEILRSKNIED